MIKVLIIGIIITLIICESFFCLIMKRKANKTKGAINESEKKTDIALEKKSIKNWVVNSLITIADSITFILFKIVGYIPCHIVRNFIYRYIFWMSIGTKAVIYYGLEARSPWNIKIGDGSIVGDKAVLDARYGIEIGENVNISTGVWMWTLQHDIHSSSFSSEGTGRKIVIGDRAWISSRATVLPGNDIAEGVVVAAGAVVSRPIKDSYTLWGGVPAKKIGDRNSNLTYAFDGKHRWFI